MKTARKSGLVPEVSIRGRSNREQSANEGAIFFVVSVQWIRIWYRKSFHSLALFFLIALKTLRFDRFCRPTSPLIHSLGLAAVALCMGGVGVSDALADEATGQRKFQSELVPMLRTFCYDCHGTQDGEGELSLEADDSIEKVLTGRQHWMRAKAQVQLGTMPPVDGDPMDAATRARMVELIDELANAVNCVQNPNAGRVALRRLNRSEYQNTIRDLTGVDYAPAADFPGDDVGYGFDTIGDVLSLPPLLMEKYLDAAEAITGEAIITPPPPRLYSRGFAPDAFDDPSPVRNGVYHMNSNATTSVRFDAPFDGTYTVDLVTSGDQGGDEPVRIEVNSGGQKHTVDVPETDPAKKTVVFQLKPGDREIEVSFLNDYYVANQADRNFRLHHIEINGEERKKETFATPKLSVSHRYLLFQTPNSKTSFESAAAAVMGRFVSRAFRRPASQSEIDRFVALADSVRSGGASFEESMQVAMQAVLVSPYFLFRVERPQQPDESGKLPLINDYELATRISYFLWSSMPDNELLQLARRSELRDRAKLLEKVGRMIQDPRASRFVENFAAQWLQLRNLDDVDPDTKIYRGFDDEIRQAMRTETLMFFSQVMKNNLPVTRLIDADFTYLNEALAKFYGVDGVRGDEFRLVSTKDTPRGGLLTHASILTVTSNPTRTSPVKRGKWILDNLLNTPPPPAPPNIPELEKAQLTGTLRQRMEQHRSDPACAACHNMMDPLGFALEHFDAVGRYRTRDGRDPIDASGEMPDGTRFTGADGLKNLLADQRKDQFVRCLVEKMMIYSLGRGTEYYDKCAIDEIMATVRTKDYRFAYVIAAIIESEPFQKQGYRE